MIGNNGTIAKDLRLIVTQYNRSMPHCTTGKWPAKLFLGRKIRGKLDVLKPKKRIEQKSAANEKLKVKKKFNLNDRMIARNCNSKDKWIPGTVVKLDGKLHYKVQLDDGRVWRRHANQLSLAKDFNVPQQSSKIVGNSDRNQSVNTKELDNTV